MPADLFSGFQRHDLVRVAPATWAAVLATRPDLDGVPHLAGWAEAGWPLIVRRFVCGEARDRVPLGLPLPPADGKRRISFAFSAEDLVPHATPTLQDARTAAPAAWQATLDALIALGMQHDIAPRPFGSLLWEAVTGLAYLTSPIERRGRSEPSPPPCGEEVGGGGGAGGTAALDPEPPPPPDPSPQGGGEAHDDPIRPTKIGLTHASDLDVLWPLATPAMPAGLLQNLARIAETAPMRLDGEILLPDGAGLHWRELFATPPGGEVLAKHVDRLEMLLVSSLRTAKKS